MPRRSSSPRTARVRTVTPHYRQLDARASPGRAAFTRVPSWAGCRSVVDESRRRRSGRSQGSRRSRQSRVRVFGRSLSVLAPASWAFEECGPGLVRRKFLGRGTTRNGRRHRRHVPNRHGGRADLAAARAVLEARPPLESPRHAEAGRAERPHRVVPSRVGNGRRGMRRCVDARRPAVCALDDRRGQRRGVQPRRRRPISTRRASWRTVRLSPNRGAERFRNLVE